ncbi:hypothetical protein PW52_15345 [Tamlana sedimentorum]|uniref:Cyclic nucleotide-binding domain-containing protein n=1 Tax=Neotamlana sedimentorum TaxID=1435349 RepID=A0A0D7W200_9FLAO|nr:Crp/Fnr family transcriptional regulator [Tamlana sedimentorum]KJD32733.1 hypothetical protein PW52_15345 [Tamlana sedimentorum]
MNQIIQFLRTFYSISDQTYLDLLSISKLRRVKAGECYVNSGEIPVHMFTLVTGVVRAYVRTENGKEYNKKIYIGPSITGSLAAIIKNEPSIYSLEALTDCEVYTTNYKEYLELGEKNPEIKELYIKMLEIFFMEYERRQLDFLTMSATDRYLKLKDEVFNIEDLIPQYQIAAYLSITPVQLSRIRKKLKEINML